MNDATRSISFARLRSKRKGEEKRGRESFFGTVLRVLRTNDSRPLVSFGCFAQTTPDPFYPKVVAWLIVLVACCGVVDAASLVDMRLVVDGSVEPPGDRLDVAVYLLPGEEAIELRVCGFVVSEGDAPESHPLAAKDGSPNRDPEGRLLVSARFSRRRGTADARGQIIIRYADLDLAPGVHKIAYEITGVCQSQVAFVRATPFTRVTVTDQVRTETMRQRVTFREAEAERRELYVPGERQRGAPGKLEKKEIRLVNSVPMTVEEKVAVSIPGEFAREELVSSEDVAVTDPLPNRPNFERWKQTPWWPLSEVESQPQRIVHFATNRNREELAHDQTEPATPKFGSELSADVTYGAALVNLPVKHHKKGKLETHGWLSNDPEKYFHVESLTPLSVEDFQRSVRRQDVLLYVHGFRNTMDSAVLKVAQLRYDLEFPGTAVAFCWPSEGGLSEKEYNRAAERGERSVAALAEVLAALSKPAGASGNEAAESQIHVIAHSLGNRLLLKAIYQLYESERFRIGTKPLGQVVLAAPDVGAAQFNNLLPYVLEFSDRVTYYFCRNDAALAMSRKINFYEPVGLIAFFERGLDTINADGANTSFLGHDYFASSVKVLLDIQLMVNHGLAPEKRMPPLESQFRIFGHNHWSFTPMTYR